VTTADPTQLAHSGAEAAAQALSQLLHTTFLADAPRAADAAGIAAAADAVVVSFDTSGGVEGTLAVVIDDDVARWLVGRLTGGGPAEGALGEPARAALAELGNIAASAFLNAAARLLRRSCLPSVPRVGLDPSFAALPAPVVATMRADGRQLRLVFSPRAVA
jgi:chemotaxis protein CheY-P-specific phosphatase CheC